MSTSPVTEEEIKKAEEDVLLGRTGFSDQQKEFLKTLTSCSLQSYAGTGKTSVLVAKLHILAQKRIWEKGEAICVVSHTNIAVDEIKNRVAVHYPEIMQYPNFVGTIQEFVNKFLFVPYLSSLGLRMKFQDELRYINYSEAGDAALKTRIQNRLAQLRRSGAYVVSSFYETLNSLALCDGQVIDPKSHASYSGLVTQAFSQETSDARLGAVIGSEQEKGKFLYSESFICAEKFLAQAPLLERIIRKRFRYVLLDEAQDCSDIQIRLLERLFRYDSVSLQQIGDINQAITESAWTAPSPVKYLDKSMRCGSDLTSFIAKFCITSLGDASMSGSSHNSQRVLIVYSDPNGLLPAFDEILTSKEIPHDSSKGSFVIAYKHEHLGRLFPDYYSKEVALNKRTGKSPRFLNDIDFVLAITPESINANGSSHISSMIFNLLYKHFKSDGTWFELKELLSSNIEYKKLLIALSSEILSNGKVSNMEKLASDLNGFLGAEKIRFEIAEQRNRTALGDNVYFGAGQRPIKIGTIHSVKGQTHNATLFVSDTEKTYRKYDIEHALDNGQGENAKKHRKLLYVASSRPQDLFAFAIHKDVFDALSDKSCFDGFETVVL